MDADWAGVMSVGRRLLMEWPMLPDCLTSAFCGFRRIAMEPVGVVIEVLGLAGLFNSCLEAVDKVQPYRTSVADSHVLNTRFDAAKVRFERWGPRVEIEQHGLSDTKQASGGRQLVTKFSRSS